MGGGRWDEGEMGYELGVEFGEAGLAVVVEDEHGVDHRGRLRLLL